MISKWT